MIPTTLHHVWVGPRPVPDEWIAAWREMHPSWEHRLWREADLTALPMLNREHFDALLTARCWHGAADIARVEILLRHGGVYVDVDSKPLQTFDGAPFMDATIFAGLEPTPSMPGRVANGTIGAVADHHVLRQLARAISEMETTDPPYDTIGGTALTAILALHRHCSCRPLILPPRTFYATDAHGRPVPGREQPYSEHFWATTNRMYTGRVVVLVPRRVGDPVRDRAWEFVHRHWEQTGWPIFEGHHDEGPFNAAAARNEAARLAGDWDVAVFLDADTIPRNMAAVERGVALAASSGHLVQPFRQYVNLDEAASDAVLAGGPLPAPPARAAHWDSGVKLFEHPAHGGIVIVPRLLWEAVRGHDERFQGWGSEDTAFKLACKALGGAQVIDGDVLHLWHPLQERDQTTPQYRANVALRTRYERASRRPAHMRMLVEERFAEPKVDTFGVMVITNGRRETISATIPSIETRVSPIHSRLIVDDSGDPEYADWLRATFPEYAVDAHPHMGHNRAIPYAMAAASRLPVDWVFVCEDDFEFQRDVNLGIIAAEMDAQPNLVQMVIRRQAWFAAEIEAGGMIERFDPALFTEHAQNGTSWIEHRQFYSMNPHLVRRSTLRRQVWPRVEGNLEHHFSRRLFRDRRLRAGIWGAKADEPWAIHSGERVGTGY